jgi:hypothetical protein
MSLWERLAEQKLRRAIEDGLLEDLPGRGRRLEMPDDVLVPEEWRAAWHVLKTSGHLPAWLDLHKEAETRLEAALGDLRRAARGAEDRNDEKWTRARERFGRQIEECNTLIDRANLRLDHPSLHRPRINVEREAVFVWQQAAGAQDRGPTDGSPSSLT